MIRLATCVVVAAAIATALGCGGSSPEAGSRFVRYHDPSGGWTAEVPAGWTSVGLGPEFLRGEPLADPTRLLVRTYRNHSPAAALRALAVEYGITVAARAGERAGDGLRWQRYQGEAGEPDLSVELAVAKEGADARVAALTARRAELERLVRTALLPALDSFASGSPDQPASVLARTPPEPSYWPTAGWRSASPASQGMDGKRLDEMIAAIRAAKLPIDSVTVIRHGNIVLDSSFGPFASGTLGEPYASGRLHELQSVTKSSARCCSGSRCREDRGRHQREDAGAANSPPLATTPEAHAARKRAMTIEELLTISRGWPGKIGYPIRSRDGNDVMAMLETKSWTTTSSTGRWPRNPARPSTTTPARLTSCRASSPSSRGQPPTPRRKPVRAARHPTTSG